MRAIILAAGCGKRLAPMGWHQPKCLLEIGGQTLLQRTLDACAIAGVTGATIVLGFQHERVRRQLQSSPVPPDVLINEAYETTNTLHSLWIAPVSYTHLTLPTIYSV